MKQEIGQKTAKQLNQNKKNFKMKKKYKEFAEKFEILCEEYRMDDFDVKEVREICNEIIIDFGE